ncbi:tyrosine-type recombinase/integrase [Rhodopirellula baltica]|uniref:Protein containing Integrase, catalytic core, phage domain n=1 Tax=Rhodopirellula baltica WH47 TaxID=991778 RepID=F2AU29_RHOBT|nr:site-specific integrase [Rhodopirellula baltica]EGF26820.1 protein containing Integrase, catalytic core, phage domain [Rhodopirellula baltica WH47]
MSHSNSHVPSYRKHASGQARVTINGRDYYLGRWKSPQSIEKYNQLIGEYLGNGKSANFGHSPQQLTVAMIMADYLKHARAYYGTGKSSEWHRIKAAISPLKDLYASFPATDFGPQQYKAVRQAMIDHDLSRPGINHHMQRVVRMFKWAAAEGMIPASVFETLRLIPGLKSGRTEAPDTEPILPVDQAVVDATLPKLSPIVRDMVRVQLLIGCRPGEVCKLTPGCIDRSKDVWIATIAEHKTKWHGHSRVFAIGPEAQAILLPYMDRGEEEHLFRPVDAMELLREERAAKRTTPKSCGNRRGLKRDRGGLRGKKSKKQPGVCYTTESYRRAIHNGCDKAFPAPEGLTKEQTKQWKSDHRWSPNRLRHTRGTEIRQKFGLEAAQVILGHKNADVTQIYAERDLARAIEIAREVG